MTTKLTEAEVKALPVCKCGYPPHELNGHSGFFECMNNKCPMCRLTLNRDQWRLLMTPEAHNDATTTFNQAINTLYALNEAAKLVPVLQSKLKIADEVIVDAQRAYEANMKEMKQQLAEMEGLAEKFNELKKNAEIAYRRERDAIALSNENSIMRAEIQQENAELTQQLAEATNPVGDEELEKKLRNALERRHTHPVGDHGYVVDCQMRDILPLIRAARQRKPSENNCPRCQRSYRFVEEWQNRCCDVCVSELGVKPSGDVIAMAQWVSDNRRFIGEGSSTLKGALSILAQAAAGEAKDVADTSGVATDYGYVQALEKLKVARVPAADLLTADCNCLTWASDDIRRRMWGNGHHETCVNYKPMVGMSDLLSEICSGIENWGGEEDGIYPGIWEAYKKVKFFVSGKVITDTNPPAPAPSAATLTGEKP